MRGSGKFVVFPPGFLDADDCVGWVGLVIVIFVCAYSCKKFILLISVEGLGIKAVQIHD